MESDKRKFGHFMFILIFIMKINYLLAEDKYTPNLKLDQLKSAKNLICLDKTYIQEVAKLMDNLICQCPEIPNGKKVGKSLKNRKLNFCFLQPDGDFIVTNFKDFHSTVNDPFFHSFDPYGQPIKRGMQAARFHSWGGERKEMFSYHFNFFMLSYTFITFAGKRNGDKSTIKDPKVVIRTPSFNPWAGKRSSF